MARIPHRLTLTAGLALVAALALTGCTSSGTSKPGVSSAVPVSTPGTSVPASATSPATSPTTAPSTTPSTSASSTTPGSDGSSTPVHQRLSDVRVSDVTFVGNEGWLLGTATCLDGSGQGCTAVEHSTDQGRTWTSIAAPAGVVVPVGPNAGTCTANCLTGIRFATATTGYLFGDGADGALFQTTDGGQHWVRQSGTADAIEVADDLVVRVTDKGNCPPGCVYSVRLSVTDRLSGAGRDITLPGARNQGDGAELGRSGPHVYLLSLSNPAGGAQRATSVLWTSSNGGDTWTNRGEPCPQPGSEYDSSELSVGPDGSAAVLCRQRIGQRQFLATTTPSSGGAHFTAASTTALGAAPVTAVGTVSASTVVVSSDDTYRTTDGGSRFTRLSADAGSSPGQVSWVAFSSSTVGHAISLDRKTLWLTTDGGRTWSSTTPH